MAILPSDSALIPVNLRAFMLRFTSPRLFLVDAAFAPTISKEVWCTNKTNVVGRFVRLVDAKTYDRRGRFELAAEHVLGLLGSSARREPICYRNGDPLDCRLSNLFTSSARADVSHRVPPGSSFSGSPGFALALQERIANEDKLRLEARAAHPRGHQGITDSMWAEFLTGLEIDERTRELPLAKMAEFISEHVFPGHQISPVYLSRVLRGDVRRQQGVNYDKIRPRWGRPRKSATQS